MTGKNFADRLTENIHRRASRVAIGCDPDSALLPRELTSRYNALTALEAFGTELITAAGPAAVAVKFQSAFYERFGSAGICILEKHLAVAREVGLLTVLDVKRGDVGHTSETYAIAYLAAGAPLEADAVTVTPYLGRDTLETFADVARRFGKGIFVLVKTSNKSAGDIQDLQCSGRKVFEVVAELTKEVGENLVGESGYSAVGAVIGATYAELIPALRDLMPRQYFLLPGVGAQGGKVNLLRDAFDDKGLGALVAASRSVAFAYRDRPGVPWAEAAREAAYALRDEVNAVFATRAGDDR